MIPPGGGLKFKDISLCSPRKLGEDSHVDEHMFQMGWFNHLHPRNLTYPLKNDGWKMSFLSGLPICSGYVKFPGCNQSQFVSK